MSVNEIEAAIMQLPTEELDQLMTWLEEYYAQMWDEQIGADLESGQLDALLAEIEVEYEGGLARPL